MRVASKLTRHFKTTATSTPSFGMQTTKIQGTANPPIVSWRGTQDNQWQKSAMFIGVLVTAGAGAVYHEFTAEGHVPTTTSTAPVGSKIAREATLGIFGFPTPAQSQEVKHPQRQRMSQIKSPEVRGVNAVCDEEGIPLEAQIADIFIMHDKLSPEIGSPLDSAFEHAIIKQFKKEFDEGMTEGQAIAGVEQSLAAYEASNELRRRNSVSAIGVAAHSSYQKSKETTYKAKMAAKHPERTSKVQYTSHKDTFSEDYQRDVEFYREKIEGYIADIEAKIEENRAAGMYLEDRPNGPDEIRDRDNFVTSACNEIKSIAKDYESSKKTTKSNIQTTRSFKAQAETLRSDAKNTSAAQQKKTENKKSDDGPKFSI